MTDDTDGAHFLFVGDSHDIPAVRAMAERLPTNAYGQIYLEVTSPLQVQRWPLPPGVTVTWLRRDRHPRIAPRGDLAARAAEGWIAEWMPGDAAEPERPFILWVGCGTNRTMDRLHRELHARLEGD